MFSCGKQPWGNLWGQQKKHHGNYAYSEYSTHSSPRCECVSLCECVCKCSHESSAVLVDEAVTRAAPLLSFLWMHTESNSSSSWHNYGNFWRFVGTFFCATPSLPKICGGLWWEAAGTDLCINVRACSRMWRILIVLTAQLKDAVWTNSAAFISTLWRVHLSAPPV